MVRRKDRINKRRKDMIDGKKEGHDIWKEGRTGQDRIDGKKEGQDRWKEGRAG
jgi:hypothetical protein